MFRIFKISTIDCVGDFVNDGVCVADNVAENCGPGKQKQKYEITTPAQHTGTPCPNKVDDPQVVVCDTGRFCPIDCKGNYELDFSECSAMCGGGEKTKKFTITEEAQHNGAPCPTDIVEPCNTQECIYDCIGDFKDFKPCSKDCGGGIKLEKYEITQESNKLGIDCPYSNNFIKAIPCNMQACPTYPINTIIQEALKESNDRIQESRYKIIDTQYEIDNLNNDLNIVNNKLIKSKFKTKSNYIPVDKTLKFY